MMLWQYSNSRPWDRSENRNVKMYNYHIHLKKKGFWGTKKLQTIKQREDSAWIAWLTAQSQQMLNVVISIKGVWYATIRHHTAGTNHFILLLELVIWILRLLTRKWILSNLLWLLIILMQLLLLWIKKNGTPSEQAATASNLMKASGIITIVTWCAVQINIP